jgi:hypothetical protein
MDRVFSGAASAPAAGFERPPAAAAPAPAKPPKATASGEPAIEVEVRDERPFGARFFGGARLFPSDWPTPEWVTGVRSWKPNLPRPSVDAQLLAVVLGLMTLFTAGSSLLLWRGWNQARLDLRQERNLQLLERLRTIGFGQSVATAPAAPLLNGIDKSKTLTLSATGVSTLPPPPPEEAWMQQLEPLQSPSNGGGSSAASSSVGRSNVLRVPFSRNLTNPGPPPPVSSASAGAAASRSADNGDGGSGGGSGGPELVGVVQAAGRSGSAIFKLGSSSTNVGVGEMIGASGWRLSSTNGDTAVIERGSVQRMVSISGGF